MNLVVTRLVPVKQSALQPVRFSRARGSVNPYCAVVAENTQRVRPPHPPKEIRIATAHIGRTPISPENIDTRRRHSPADSFRLQYADTAIVHHFVFKSPRKFATQREDLASRLVGIPMSATPVVQRGYQVRFTVFYKPQGPFLSYCFAPASSFSDRAGAQFGTAQELVEALNRVGLPGSEIATPVNDKIYGVTDAQLRTLGIQV